MNVFLSQERDTKPKGIREASIEGPKKKSEGREQREEEKAENTVKKTNVGALAQKGAIRLIDSLVSLYNTSKSEKLNPP